MTKTLSPVMRLLLSWVLCDTETIMLTFFKDLKSRIDRGEVPTDPMVEEVTKKTAALKVE
ncbi:hypothetical protein CPC08DRAFT_824648 [Agrocybe pediades]|nr:hypothetical protein CPC08DRAFT_824648 [Agrocybe pediades]